MGHLDDLRPRLQGENTVGGVAHLHVREAQHGQLRQRRTHGGLEDAQAFMGPYLDNEFVVLVLGARAATPGLGVGRQACAQGKGRLLHLVVEQCIGLGQGAAVRQRGLRQRSAQHGREKQGQQAPAQRGGPARRFHRGTM